MHSIFFTNFHTIINKTNITFHTFVVASVKSKILQLRKILFFFFYLKCIPICSYEHIWLSTGSVK